MAGNTNAIGMLAMFLITVGTLYKYGHLQLGLKEVVLDGILPGFGFYVLLTISNSHMCDAGTPITQPVLGGICLTLLRIFARSPFDPFPRKMAWTVAIMALLLAFHFSVIVHSDVYTGNPSMVNRYSKYTQRDNIRMLSTALLIARKDGTIGASQPEGWVAESKWRPVLRESLGEGWDSRAYTAARFSAYPLWHTWLTGLYGKRQVPVELWYRGGAIDDDVQQRLEYRVRHTSKRM